MDKINLAAMVRNTGRQRTLRPVTATMASENELYLICMEGVRIWQREIKARLLPLYATPTFGMTTDADGAELQWLIDQIDRDVNNRVFYQTEKLGRWVTRQGETHTHKTIASAKSATGVDVSPYLRMSDIRETLNNSIQVNVDLIRGLDADTKRRVENIIFDGIAMRRNQKYITKALAQALGRSQRKARIIARDQTHKLNSLLTRLRNEQLGVDAYIWRTMRDDRVRKAHADREGKVFRWQDPPPDGHPGYPINCRCHSEAVLHYGDTEDNGA
ncbi:putative head morphogenesis protein [Sinorhizobium phage HMSP1-Susan]|nr:putative head morphogenesis protein [Sinorhizobium phage HMSP1-Susan]